MEKKIPHLTNGAGTTYRKIKIESPSLSYTKINPKWIKDLN